MQLLGLARRKQVKIVVDSLLLIGFLADFFTREGPDYALHSWIGVVLVPIVVIHLAGNLGWIKRVWARGREDRDFGLGVLNASFGLVVSICIVTGFPIWLSWSDHAVWGAVHTLTGFASLVIMFVHLWMNRARLVTLIR